MNILSPQFLVNNIEIISFVTSVMILVIFDEFIFGKIVFPVADFIKYKLFKGLGVIYEKKEIKSRVAKYFQRYFSEAIATILVICYCYFGYYILSEYVLEPVLRRWQAIILLVVIGLFVGMNYLINNKKLRKKIFGVDIYNPEKKYN
ncbi:MAG: hypothetical protein N3D20_00695 [Candidatus Pacearchaeota archaeon]|nr:hypothetical protein [Candidatus Pacearchaeota archaeon]